MLIGYARVSTDDQDTAAQVAALKAAGCERIFREKASGGRWDRPQFLRLLNQLRSGDVVVVWKLDRLSRSLRDVLLKGGYRNRARQTDEQNNGNRWASRWQPWPCSGLYTVSEHRRPPRGGAVVQCAGSELGGDRASGPRWRWRSREVCRQPGRHPRRRAALLPRTWMAAHRRVSL